MAKDQEIITVAEIERRYPDEWVLVQIVHDHRDHLRVAGRLLAHSPNRADLIEPHHRFRAEHPRARVYQFYTSALVAEGFVAIL